MMATVLSLLFSITALRMIHTLPQGTLFPYASLDPCSELLASVVDPRDLRRRPAYRAGRFISKMRSGSPPSLEVCVSGQQLKSGASPSARLHFAKYQTEGGDAARRANW
jgi:hypothetical protein